MLRTAAAVLLVVYSFLVVNLTLEPPSAGSWAFTFADRVVTHLSGGRLDWSETEVLANVALFVPAGFLLAIVLDRPWLAVVLCVVASAGIETAQLLYLPMRVPTVADVEHNTLGGALGALLAWPVTAYSGWLNRSRAAKSSSEVVTVPAVRPGARW